jgi:hypothetical protein
MPENPLDKHILSTYFSLRIGIIIIAIAFPFVLVISGYLYAHVSLQHSLSAYYWASAADGKSLRDVFVGVLFAVGAFLYLYKGFSNKENIALNIAGILALGVALFPTPWGCDDHCPKLTLHGTFAVGFFLSITFVAVKCAPDTLGLIQDKKRRAKFRMMYKTLAIIMLASPAAAFVLNLLTLKAQAFVLYAEAAGIFAFAGYWLTKSRELSLTHAEELAAKGEVDKATLAESKQQAAAG